MFLFCSILSSGFFALCCGLHVFGLDSAEYRL